MSMTHSGCRCATDLYRVAQPQSKVDEPAFIKRAAAGFASQGMSPLAGCTPEGLAREQVDNVSRWSFVSRVESLKGRPVLVITSDDGPTAWPEAFAMGLVKAGNNRVKTIHFATDHSYSDKRIELSAAVREWLKAIFSLSEITTDCVKRTAELHLETADSGRNRT